MDQESIKVTALCVILDLLLIFGLDAFGAVDGNNPHTGNEAEHGEGFEQNLNMSHDSEMSGATW